jgi:hypothetical protein
MCPTKSRARKEELRQRLYWARLRTRIRNRVHALIDRQAELEMPQCSDLFGRKGLTALSKLTLPEPDATLLGEDLELLKLVDRQIKAQEGRIVEFNSNDQMTLYLQSLPGMGKILAQSQRLRLIVLSASAARPSSAPMRVWCRAHMEAGQGLPRPSAQEPQQMAAMGFYRGGLGGGGLLELLRRHLSRASRSRQKGQCRITIVARRMDPIAFTLLKERRYFQEHNLPGRSVRRLTAAAA